MRKKLLIGIILLVLVIAGVAVYAARSADDTAPKTTTTTTKEGSTLAPAPSSTQTTAIPYGTLAAQTLDVYVPDTDATGLPAVIMIHGGAWAKGDSSKNTVTATEISKALPGVVFSINYRLVPDGVYPNAVDDVELALQWIKQNAATYNINPERIGVLGGSAGGHLGAMLLDDGIKGFVGWSGIYDFTLAVTDPLQGSSEAGEKPQIVNFLGCSHNDCPHIWTEASPVNLVQKDVALHLVHSTEEFIPLSQMHALEKAQQAVGGYVEAYEVPGRHHASAVKKEQLPDGRIAQDAAIEFFQKYL